MLSYSALKAFQTAESFSKPAKLTITSFHVVVPAFKRMLIGNIFDGLKTNKICPRQCLKALGAALRNLLSNMTK